MVWGFPDQKNKTDQRSTQLTPFCGEMKGSLRILTDQHTYVGIRYISSIIFRRTQLYGIYIFITSRIWYSLTLPRPKIHIVFRRFLSSQNNREEIESKSVSKSRKTLVHPQQGVKNSNRILLLVGQVCVWVFAEDFLEEWVGDFQKPLKNLEF